LFWTRRKSALLIDFENMHTKCGGRKLVERIDNWLLWLEHGKFDPAGGRREFISKQVFWVPEFEKYRLEFVKRRFEIHMCRAIRKEKASSADFDLTIRAAELRHERKDLKEIIVLSLDSDFVSVLNHIQLHDLYGVGMVDPQTKYAESYRNIVDCTIEQPDFIKAYDYAPVKRSLLGRAPAVAAAPSPASPAKPPPAHAAPPAQIAAAARFDPAAAANLVVRPAEADGAVYLGREQIRRLLHRQPGFVVNGRPWAGGSYRHVVEQMVARTARLAIEKVRNGGIVVVFKGASDAASAA
jgi:hypothetical protein